ncbi:MAG: threonine/serine dehydratase [Planktomarina sp.]
MTVNRDTILQTWDRIRPHIIRTPVVVTDTFGPEISFKMEHMQHTGSFKARGAVNSVLSMDVPDAGLAAASGGNHGAAVAWAAGLMGHKAKIFVPDIAGPAKINLIQSLGADLEVVPGEYANAASAVATYAAQTGAAQIHPFDAPDTLNGQGTVMAEWDDQGLDADTILIAVGGGGLIGGAMAWAEDTRKIVGVEPFNAPALTRALDQGPDTQVAVSGVAANALGARQIGRMCYDLATDQNIETVLVTDGAITKAQHMLWSKLRQLVEPAGATALAALLSGAYVPEPGEKVAVLLCGANPAPSPL